jgi:colanic acid/amylovoran biosynthesis protein
MKNKVAGSSVRVGLLWHSAGSTNLGVGALTIANMSLIRGVAEEMGLTPEFTIIGMRDNRPAYVSPDQAEIYAVDNLSLINPANNGAWGVIRAQDCVIDIGGGDSFTDIYGVKRFVYLWWTKMMAIWQGVPLLLAPQTIGPFERPICKSLARVAMNASNAVVARDSASLAFVQNMAPKAHDVLSVDVAFTLPYEDQSHLRGGEKIRVGVNVSGLLFNQAEHNVNRFGLDVDYAKLMRRFLTALAARPDVEVHLIVHVQAAEGATGWDEDTALADSLSKEYPGTIRVPEFAGPSEAKTYISGLDFLVAGRMHACIAAFSSGVPVVPVAYSRKFSGLFEMLDYPWMIPVKGVEDDQAFTMLMDCLERRDELAKATATSMIKVRGLLDSYRDALRALFRKTTGQ